MTGKIIMKNHAIQHENMFLDLINITNKIKIEMRKIVDKMNDPSNGVFTSGTT
ncbi:MAG: hypothetical protein HZC52_08260 [Planctomycetes bacterium]|nr:hypothetical protein [Planctomycetota bacterium]